jgi:hypothetical protein
MLILFPGSISSVTVMGQTLVILNDKQLAFELMEKRSSIHSSRPKQIFAGEMYIPCSPKYSGGLQS